MDEVPFRTTDRGKQNDREERELTVMEGYLEEDMIDYKKTSFKTGRAWKARRTIRMSRTRITTTTIMAVEFDEGVVLGADSRTSVGTYVSSGVADKLTLITDRIYCCRSGSAADTQAVADIVSSRLELLKVKLGEYPSHVKNPGAPPLVEVTANSFRYICYNYRDMLMASIIVAGWDETKGGQVYTIAPGGMIVREPVSVGGSGSSYVLGYVDSAFKPNMKKEEAVDFVKKTLTLALNRDGCNGGAVRVAVITKDEVERRVFLPNELPTFYEG